MYRSMNWKGFVLIIGLILTVFLILHFSMRKTLNSQSQKIDALNANKSRQEELKQELEKQRDIDDNDRIVQSAIQNYSYVNKNDIRFEFDNPDALDRYTEEEARRMLAELAE